MNIMPFFGRNNNPIRPGNINFLSSSSTSNFKKRENMNSSHEVKINEKPKIISNNRANTNSKRISKYSNNNLINNNCNKNNLNKKNYSLFIQNDRPDLLNSKSYVTETEPNKLNNFYQKINQTQNKYINKDLNINNNKPSNNILSTYYINKNQPNKISIKKNKNSNINFNDNSPNSKNSIKLYNNNGRNMNIILNYNNENCSDNVKMKYQSNKKLNKIINKDFPVSGDVSTERNVNKINYEISIKNGKKRHNRNNTERINLHLNRPLSSTNSNIYLKTENNINHRNTSYNNKYHTNYNLINITSPKERNNSYSNINSFQKTPNMNYHNYTYILSSTQNENFNNIDIQNNKKYPKKQNYNISFNQNDNNIDKIYLNQFYEETFSNNTNDDKNMIINPNYNNKIYSEDIIYKDNLTTNQSTYTNTSKKIKNLKKSIHSSNSNIKSDNECSENIENFEELHFFIITSLQKGNYLGKNFD